jgi:GNAT superfamily N-acetyltransferase
MVREYNNQQSIHHNDARKEGSVHPINVMVSDDNNQWGGGITAEVYWNWVELTWFWFSEAVRGKGLGSSLIREIEELAKGLGATRALVTTFEFQARSFYELHGYKVVGEIKDYPPGSSYYTMVKSLNREKK